MSTTPTCYFCGAVATSKEHVPPKALFPKASDVPGGLDYRKDLRSVPSCHLHNNATSKDDEYLLYLLTMSLPANDVGKSQFFTKVMRAIRERPALATRISNDSVNVTVLDAETGKRDSALGLRVDDARLGSVLEKILRGLYFLETGSSWNGSVNVLVGFTLQLDGADVNERVQKRLAAVGALLAGQPHQGVHPDVFSYQSMFYDGNHIFLMTFYGQLPVIGTLGGVGTG